MRERSKYQVQKVFDEALALFDQKNHDYGDAWREQGWRGNLSRVLEKASRLRTIWRNGSYAVSDEDLRQTAVDMLNTLAFLVINHDEGIEFGHEQPIAPSVGIDPGHPAGYHAYDPAATNWMGPDLVRAMTRMPGVPQPEPPLLTHSDTGSEGVVVVPPEQVQKAIDLPAEVPLKPTPRPRKRPATDAPAEKGE